MRKPICHALSVTDFQLTLPGEDSPLPTDPVEALRQQLAVAEAKILHLEDSTVKPLTEILDHANAFETKLYEEYQAKLMKHRDKVLKERHKLNDALHDINLLAGDVKALEAALVEAEQKKTLEEKYSELAGRLKLLAENMMWFAVVRPHQWTGILAAWAAYEDGRRGFCIFDDRGLGKTFMAVAFLLLFRVRFMQKHGRVPAIIWITKKNLRLSSMREIYMANAGFDESKLAESAFPILTLSGNKETDEIVLSMVTQLDAMLITNYDSIRTRETIRQMHWDLIIIDEVHQLKGGESAAKWHAAKEICHKPDTFMLFLSGSPIQNESGDIWAYLHLMDPDMFPNRSNFDNRFSLWNGKIAVDTLLKFLGPRCIRRDKNDVKLDLPEKTRQFYYLEMGEEQRALYEQMKEKFFIWLAEQNVMLSATAIIAQLIRLRQIALHPNFTWKDDKGHATEIRCSESIKVEFAMELISDLVEEGEQVVVWTGNFNHVFLEPDGLIDRLTEAGITWRMLDGTTTDDPTIETDFQDGKYSVLLANLKSGAEGLNLQKHKEKRWEGGASHAIFMDLWYNPKMNEQAEDRIHRDGAPAELPVTIHILHAEESVDNFIAALLEKKEEMISDFADHADLRGKEAWTAVLKDLI